MRDRRGSLLQASLLRFVRRGHGHSFNERINCKIVSFIEQVIQTAEVILRHHSGMTHFLAFPPAQKKTNSQRKYKQNVQG